MREQLDIIVGEFNQMRSLQWDSQDLVNWYIDVDDTGVTKGSLNPLPNILLYLQILAGDFQYRPNCIYSFNNVGYVVLVDQFYSFDSSGGFNLLGSIGTDTGYISWTNDTTQIGFVDGVNLYVYNTQTGVFSTITTIQGAGFPTGPQSIYFQDARAILSFSGSNVYYYSNQGDITSWDSTQTFVQQSRPTAHSTGISGANERLFLFGTFSVEVWEPVTTNQLLPFTRDNNFNWEFGCGATGSIVKGILDTQRNQPVTGFVFWLSSNPTGNGAFLLSTGGPPIKISSIAVDLLVRDFGDVSNCFSVVYKSGGHVFIENTFPTVGQTLVIDLTSMCWLRKISSSNSYSPICGHTYFGGIHYVVERFANTIQTLSVDNFTENGNAVHFSRITKTLFDKTGRRMQLKFLEIFFDVGSLENSPLGIVPYCFLSVSLDGGITWGNQLKAEIGQLGQYRWRTQFFGLGMAYNFTFKIDIYDPIQAIIFGGFADIEYYNE